MKMDENWLLLEDKKYFYWWNCRTQQLSGPKFRPVRDKYTDLHILPSYEENQIPSYMITVNMVPCVVTDDQVVQCKALSEKADNRTRVTVLKDNRVCVSRRRGA